MNNQTKVEVSPLFIDKLSFLLKPKRDLNYFYDNALEIITTSKKEIIKSAKYTKGERYKHSFIIELGNNTHCLAQFKPLQECNAAFRFELNPAHAGHTGINILQNYLIQFFGESTEELMRQAFFSSLDIAADISYVNVDDLMIFREKTKRSAMYWGENGKVETVYLGSPRSDKQIKAYNKRVEALENRNIDLTEEKTRVECSLRPRNCQLSDLLKIDNPFAGLHMLQTDDSTITNTSDLTRMFIDSCRYRGMAAALERVHSLERRTQLRSRFVKRYKANWWNVETLWNTFGNAIYSLNLFPPPNTVCAISVQNNPYRKPTTPDLNHNNNSQRIPSSTK